MARLPLQTRKAACCIGSAILLCLSSAARLPDRFDLRLATALPLDSFGDSWNHRFITASSVISWQSQMIDWIAGGFEILAGTQYHPEGAYLFSTSALLSSRIGEIGKTQFFAEFTFGLALTDVGAPSTGQPANFLTGLGLLASFPDSFPLFDGLMLKYRHLSNGGLDRINNGLDQIFIGLVQQF